MSLDSYESSRRIRVAQVIYTLEIGGLEKVALSLIDGLDKQRFESYLVCLNGSGQLREQLTLDEHHRLLLNRRSPMRFGPWKFDIAALSATRRFLREREIDVVHLHNVAPLVYGGLAARLLPRRPSIVYSEHNQVYRATDAMKRRFRQCLRLADRAIAVSGDLHQYLTERLRVPVGVEVIYNGIPAEGADLPAASASVREEFNLRPDDLVIGTAVVLSEQKGLSYLLDAMPRIVREVPRARLLIAGDGALRQSLERQSEAAGLQEHVRFVGYRRDVPRLISAFDVYVLPSLWEGLPLALLEALACGKPIVATRVGGNPEIVEDGVNGYLVQPRDPDAIAGAIIKVLRDDGFRADVAARNRRKFSESFSLRSMLRAHENLYEDVAARRALSVSGMPMTFPA